MFSRAPLWPVIQPERSGGAVQKWDAVELGSGSTNGGSAPCKVCSERTERTTRSASDVVRVCVVGYGYWGPNIVRNLTALANCEVVAVCDKNPAALSRASRSYPGVQLTVDCAE